MDNLVSVKAGYDVYEDNFGLFRSQIDWLIKQAEKAERYEKVLNYINELAEEFFVEGEDEVYYIPDNPKVDKSTLQEIFVVSHEAVDSETSEK